MGNKTLVAVALDYPITLRGGVGVIVESLLEHLSVEFDVLLISPDAPQTIQSHPCYARIAKHLPFHPEALTRADARKLAQSIRDHGASLVHFHAGGHLGWGTRSGWKSPLPFLACLKIPTLFAAHQITPLLEGYCAKDRPLWYKLALLPPVWLASTFALANASSIMTDSRHDAELLQQNYPFLKNKVGFMYHSRLDADEPVTFSREGRETFILSVGHIAFRKGQDILAEAFAKIAHRYPAWRLLIAGPVLEGACSERIEQIREKYNLQERIEMTGSDSIPGELMKRAGLFVQPSRMEAFGLALQEAMFWGCPCIGSNTGGIPELITHERTGLLVHPGDADALSDALVDLLNKPEKQLQLGKAAHSSIVDRGMTGQAMADHYAHIYRKLLSQP